MLTISDQPCFCLGDRSLTATTAIGSVTKIGSWRFMWCCQVVLTTTNSIIALNLYYLIANTNKQNAPCGNVFG